MPSLDDDIARIAALRGRPAQGYVDRARRLPLVPLASLEALFMGNPDPRQDIAVFDRLPTRSRRFITECPLQLSAVWWADLLLSIGEEALIRAVVAHVDGQVQDWLRRHYRDHPSARRPS